MIEVEKHKCGQCRNCKTEWYVVPDTDVITPRFMCGVDKFCVDPNILAECENFKERKGMVKKYREYKSEVKDCPTWLNNSKICICRECKFNCIIIGRCNNNGDSRRKFDLNCDGEGNPNFVVLTTEEQHEYFPNGIPIEDE